ncbi:MAG TPA: hypothetical protein VGL38_06965 [bacterium]|jgi:hypothetical protein
MDGYSNINPAGTVTGIQNVQPGTPSTPSPTYPQPQVPGNPQSIPEIPVPGTTPPAPGPAQPEA